MLRTCRSLILLAVCVAALTACGGGGNAASSSNATTATPAPTATANNVQPIIVDQGPASLTPPAIDEAFTSVTICAPANPAPICQTIDHVLVDTGSSGLRIISSALTPAMTAALSKQTTSGSNTLVECTQFVDGFSWGPIRSVNFQIAGESALATQGMLMQVMGDSNFSTVPPECSGGGVDNPENTVDAFGANGVIGVSVFQQDCGAACACPLNSLNCTNPGYYYTCSSSSCTQTSVSLAQQAPNPVSLFATDNNGVIVSLPSIASGGAVSVSGTMTFGVGTQSNNTLVSAAVYQMDPYGEFTTIFDGVHMTESYIDSGSNGLYFPNLTNIAVCNNTVAFAGYFCPASPLNLSATILGTNGVSGLINFSIANVNAELAAYPDYAVYIPIGGPTAANIDGTYSFDWGLPFFFGRNVFVVTENQTVGNQTGPFIAF